MTRNDDDLRRGAERLAEHARECDECGAAPLPLGDVARALAGYAVAVDAAALSDRVLAALGPELARLASVWFWRRLARMILAALVPLPVVLAFDAYALSTLYEWTAALLPGAVATYLVASYAALLLLLFATTYAAIPLVLARDAWTRSVARAEAVS